MDVDDKVKHHMQELNKALENDNTEKMGRHYAAILELYGYYD